jgi:putative nucleotidyltransferase with HDIG domain
LLGLNVIKALVLTTGVFAPMEGSKFPPGFSLDALWRHSMIVGAYAQAICQAEGVTKEVAGDAYTAGLLHDTGKLVFASSNPSNYTRVSDYAVMNSITLADAEKKMLECTHGEVGAYLLGIWGLPHTIIESVAYHHKPGDSIGSTFSPLTAVHSADVIAFARQKEPPEHSVPKMDMAYLNRLGLADRLDSWTEVCATMDAKGDG